MVFCTYCGKQFTRKEHLERHLHHHTNVKPHRCSGCMLSFSRRDLLQRHYSTYHEEPAPAEPPPADSPTIAGRTPIACHNCAQAKTGCDKRVPCTRCSSKSLNCEPRFARRSSKAALRAAKARDKTTLDQTSGLPQRSPIQVPAVNPVSTEPDNDTAKSGVSIGLMASPELYPMKESTGLPRRMSSRMSSSNSPSISISNPSPAAFSSPHPSLINPDDFPLVENDFTQPDTAFSNMVWSDYSLGLSVDPGTFTFDQPDMDMPISSFPDLGDITSSSGHIGSSQASMSHTRSTSIISTVGKDMIPEPEAVTAAQAAWPLARCNPLVHSGECPRTAIIHLEALERMSKNNSAWEVLERHLEQLHWNSDGLPSVTPIESRTRDMMLAIMQTFLHKALEIHRGGVNGQNQAYGRPSLLSYLVLPPSAVLECFLRSCVRNLSFFYSLVSLGSLDANELVQNNQASTLLVFLMIAQGASAIPSAEARALTTGLVETCRISLFDIIEKDVELCADPITLQCSLLSTLLGAWSGDKWLMDIAMGQRGMYLSMLKHAGMLERRADMIPVFDNSMSTELQWRDWLHRERQNRLVYNWVIVDQELSLFHDTTPILSASELLTPLPSLDMLWSITNAEDWLSGMQSVYNNVNPQLFPTQSSTPSLRDLFQDFLEDKLSGQQSRLSPQQLRLLLHPIQAILCHVHQLLSCFHGAFYPVGNTSRTVTRKSTLAYLEEVRSLLQKWYNLNRSQYQQLESDDGRINLLVFHLMSLNAVTNFPEIERLARREEFDGSYWDMSLPHNRYIYHREEAIFHCGQVFRQVRSISMDRRPSWWGAAIYRATLVLFAHCVSRLNTNFQRGTGSVKQADNPVRIDQLTPEDPPLISYVWKCEGTPVLTKSDCSGTVGLESPWEVIDHAINTLEKGAPHRFTDGIKRKLRTLGSHWGLEGLSASHHVQNNDFSNYVVEPTLIPPN